MSALSWCTWIHKQTPETLYMQKGLACSNSGSLCSAAMRKGLAMGRASTHLADPGPEWGLKCTRGARRGTREGKRVRRERRVEGGGKGMKRPFEIEVLSYRVVRLSQRLGSGAAQRRSLKIVTLVDGQTGAKHVGHDHEMRLPCGAAHTRAFATQFDAWAIRFRDQPSTIR